MLALLPISAYPVRPYGNKWGKRDPKYLAKQVRSLFASGVKIVEQRKLKGIHLKNYVSGFKLAIQHPSTHEFEHFLQERPCLSLRDLEREDSRLRKKLWQEHKIRLIFVPYWWDGTPQSLAGELSKFVDEDVLTIPVPDRTTIPSTVGSG